MAASDNLPAGGREGPDPVPDHIVFEGIDAEDDPKEYLLYDNRRDASDRAFIRISSTAVVTLGDWA